MGEQYDVIVVGARCAGSPLATLLARQGLRVAVIERVTFPRDTLSTHIVEAPAINFLRRLGVLDAVRATGVTIGTRVDGRQDDYLYEVRAAHRPGDDGAYMSARRFVLDPILAEAARRADAEISAVFTPGRLLAATASLMARSGADRGAVLREVGDLLREDVRRRRLMQKPAFLAPDAQRDAGETEVPEQLVTA
jgi:hypothetical protein